MKKIMLICIAGMLLAGLSAVSPAADMGEATITPAAACPVMGTARELGLLVLGIGWEAVRIVLPESCPAKEKDIDGLIGAVKADK